MKWLKKKSQKPAGGPFARRANWLILLSALHFSGPLRADNPFFSPTTVKAQELCYRLKLDSALLLANAELDRDKTELSAYLIKHLALTLQAFVSERPNDRKQLYRWHDLAKRQFAVSSTHSPYRNFGLAEMDFHMALIKGSEGKYMDAAMHLNQSLKQLRTNQRRFPLFVLNGKTLGLLNAYLSTVPDQYNWAVRILGFQGDLEAGMQQLEAVSASAALPTEVGLFPIEATYLLAFAKSHVERNPELGSKILSEHFNNERSSLLTCFFKANLSFKLRRNSEVISVLERRPRQRDYTTFHLLDYMLGAAYLFQLDPRCETYLTTYLDHFPGSNYKQASRMRLSWWYLLQGDTKRSDMLRSAITQHNGQAVTEEDLLAERYAQKPPPNVELLRARLLFDGGSYQQALEQIRDRSFSDYSSVEERTEYCYRKARIYMEVNKWTLAVQFFEAAIEQGAHSSEYYAAYSCLYLGQHFAELKQWEKSEAFYRKALDFPENKEFRDTIEQQARSGIQRCRKSRG